ncbi:hypothetical protein R6Q59_031973 [Mikania micrantha]
MTKRWSFLIPVMTQSDMEEIYALYPTLFSVKLHHGGIFTKFPERKYVDGKAAIVDLFDSERMSVHELDCVMFELGYSLDTERYYHYRLPDGDLDFGLLALGSDSDIIGFCKHTAKHKLMHVYTELNETTVHTYRCSPINCRIEDLSDEAFDIINQSKKQGKMLLLDWNDKGMNDNHFDPFFGGPSQVEDNSDAPQGNVDHVTGEEYNGDDTNGEEDNCDDTNSDEDNIADEEPYMRAQFSDVRRMEEKGLGID